MDSKLANDEIQALLDAAKALNIPAESLKPQNPFELKSPTSEVLQMWLREHRSDICARLSGKSGHQFSLAAIAAERGLTEHSAATRQELRENDEVFAKQEREAAASWEKAMLAEMDNKADELAMKRGINPAAPPDFSHTGIFRKYHEENYLQQQLDKQDA
jgi:hypothetical protein